MLLVPQDDLAVPTGENPGYSLAKAFSYINTTVSAKKALNWLNAVSFRYFHAHTHTWLSTDTG